MGLLSDNVWVELATVFVGISLITVWYFKRAFSYWGKRGVATVAPSFPAGNIGKFVMQKEDLGIILDKIYKKLKSKGPFSGIYLFNTPGLIVNDPELIKTVLVRDFKYFHDRSMYYNEKDEPLSAHLFFIEGQKWKSLREKFTPTFTSGKMKQMFPTIMKCGEHLMDHLKCVEQQNDIEIKDVLARFTTDVIGTCAFGIECNSLKDPDAEFRKQGLRMFQTSFLRNLKALLLSHKKLAKMFGATMFDRTLSNFFHNVVKETVAYREENKISRNDFMDLLIQLKNKGYLESDSLEQKKKKMAESGNNKTLTLNDVAAQAFLFFVAGFETSSSTMSFCLYELCLNKAAQEKARQEILRVVSAHGGQVTYESLLEMRYLDQCIYEAMRKYPVLSFLNRECINDYKMPGTNTVIPKGMPVFIPVLGLHHDPEYYPNPDKYDPDRFTEENKVKRPNFSYLPFGEGPRICIGMRFGMMQTRLGLITLLMNYDLEISKKTPVPLKMKAVSLVASTDCGIYVKLRPLNK